MELKAKIKALRQKLSECGQRELERENFTSAIRRFMRMDKLTAPLLRNSLTTLMCLKQKAPAKAEPRELLSITAL